MEARLELSIIGLDCANCANKIEKQINQLEEVVTANLNFMNGNLVVTYKDQKADEMFNTIRSLILKVEPDVKIINKNNYCEFNIDGLDCAQCAIKVEDELSKLEYLESVNIDFINKKVKVYHNNKVSEKELLKSISTIAKKVEDDLVISIEENEEEKSNLEYILFGLGAILFALGFILKVNQTISLFIYLAAYLLVGYEVLFKAIRNILRGKVFDENFLMTIATIGAFIIGEYPEGAAVMIFYQVGEYFQDLAVNRSRKSIKSLLNIKPTTANLLVNDEIKVARVEEVSIDDLVVVKPGEKVPLDGIIVNGHSSVDTSVLTGESLPREVKIDDQVLGGFINLSGLLTVKVNHLSTDSAVNKILTLVEDASSKKAPTENFISKFAAYYTPAVVFIALGMAIIFPIVLNQAFSIWFYRALFFLVVSCPCALVISIPLSFFGGIGAASRHGILVKGSNYLELLDKVDTFIFDKTGTLTTGMLEVEEVITLNSYSRNDLLRVAALGESYSNHPIAKAIIKANNEELDLSKIMNFTEIAGYGVSYQLNNQIILIGNKKLMDQNDIAIPNNSIVGSIVYVAIDNQCIGYIVINDQLKEDSVYTVNELKRLNKKVIMLTGDNDLVAQKIKNKINLDEVYSNLLPHEKVTYVQKAIDNNEKVAFVGDGINDAPSIALANLGIAMGGLGSDAAIEVSDLVIMNDAPSKLIDAIKISKKTEKIVWQNILLSLGIKFLFLALGALGFATLWEAVFADVGVALIAILNSMRIIRKQS